MTKTKTSDIDFTPVEHFPELSFWYPNLSFFDLVEMPRWAIKLYVDKLPSLMAQQQIFMIQAASFPHAKEDAQRSLMDKLEREAYHTIREEKRAPATAESPVLMARQLGAIGVGVTFVDAEGNTLGDEEILEDAESRLPTLGEDDS